MMRTPTPEDVAYAWHARALRDIVDGIRHGADTSPECGWFRRRLVRHGVYVPARIWLHSPVDIGTGELIGDEELLCEVDGKYADPNEQWLWLCGHPISRAEFDYMTAVAAHARRYEPNLPIANPRQPVNWLTAPLPVFGTQRKD